MGGFRHSISFFLCLFILILPIPALSQNLDRGGNLIFSLGGQLPSLDPGSALSNTEIRLCSSIYNCLVRVDEDGKIFPSIAYKWGHHSYVIWEFSLRKSIYFHDGSPCTSYEVKRSFDRLLKSSSLSPKVPVFRSIVGEYGVQIKRIETPDKYTIRFILNNPDTRFPYKLADISAAVVSPKFGLLDPNLPAAYSGTSAFKISEIRPFGRVVLIPYQGSIIGIPNIDRLIYEFYPDYDSLKRQILRHNVDIAPQPSRDTTIKDLIARHELNYEEQHVGVVYLLFNCRCPYLNKSKTRRIIAQAIDRAKLAEIYNGELTSSFLCSGMYGYSEQMIPYNLKNSSQYIHRFREIEDKTFTILCFEDETVSGVNLKDVANSIAYFLKMAGVNSAVKTFSKANYDRALSESSFELALYYRANRILDSDIQLSFWEPNAINYSLNPSHFYNQEFHFLSNRARDTQSIEKKKILYRKMDRILLYEMPALPLFSPTQRFLLTKRVRNVKFGRTTSCNVKNAWIDK